MNKLQIDLNVEETNLVLEALGQMPFARVADLIASIQTQARQQIQSPVLNGHTEAASPDLTESKA